MNRDELPNDIETLQKMLIQQDQHLKLFILHAA